MAEQPPNLQNTGKEIIETGKEAAIKESEKGSLAKAMEVAHEIGEIGEILRRIELSLESSKFEKPEDAKKAKEAFSKQLASALNTLKKYLEIDPLFAVRETREKLAKLGVLAEKGPGSYPKPPWWKRLFGKSQIDQWLNDIENNKLPEVVGKITEAASNAGTEALTAAAEAEVLASTCKGWRQCTNAAMQEWGKH